jgi:hypothetical protein
VQNHKSTLRTIDRFVHKGAALLNTVPNATATPTCFITKMLVTGDNGSGVLVAPGVPIDIIVRSNGPSGLRRNKEES